MPTPPTPRPLDDTVRPQSAPTTPTERPTSPSEGAATVPMRDTERTRLAPGEPGSRSTIMVSSGGRRAEVERIEPNARWGDFELLEELGRGGMGAVYRARQISLDRIVALKLMLRSTDADFRMRFQREAKALAQLDSPHVVKVFFSGEHNGQPYFVMEYLIGQDLSRRLKSGWKPTEREASDLILQAARGLAAAAARGIIHRDIKPGNLHINGDGLLKLMDFGLVRMAEEQELTNTGTVMGTVQYFSPEQGQGERCDHRSDIYSLGVVYYQLLTGRLPFIAETTASLIYQHVHTSPPPPRRLVPTISHRAEEIVLRCLDKQPANRYQAATELAADIERLMRGERAAGRRRGWRVRLPSVAIVLIVLAVLAYAWHSTHITVVMGQPVAPAASARATAAPVAPATPVPPAPPVQGPSLTAPASKGSGVHDPAVAAPAVVDAPSAPAPPPAPPVAATRPEEPREPAAREPTALPAVPLDAPLPPDRRPPAAPAPPANAPTAPTAARHPVAAASTPPAAAPDRAPAPPAPADDRQPGDPLASAPLATPVRDGFGWRSSIAVGPHTISLRWVPRGSFLMGSLAIERNRHDDETQHPVRITAGFWLAETPCTQALWKEVMGADPGRPNGANLPVNRVSRDDCHAFLAKLRARVPGLVCRLPWEAEWEYACRAGSETPYPWHGELTEDEAWFEKDDMRAAGLGTPNAWGLRDMVGNLGQWCEDSYGAYPNHAVVDPHPLDSSSTTGVGRGGDWEDTAGDCRSARRMHPWTGTPAPSMGLRIVVEGRQR